MRPSLSIIIPTYNEEENIQNTIQKISHTLRLTTITFEIIVVDDSSTDKTQLIVTDLIIRKYPVVLITRTKDPGLSQSVIAGINKARGNVVVVTDADLSHSIEIIPAMFNEIKNNNVDIAIGSRYMPNGGIKDWPLKRRVISFGATFLGRLLFPKITDPISGFFGAKKDLIMHTPSLNPRCGYKILLEILSKCHWTIVKELPYVFTNRKVGESKLKKSTIIQFAKQFIDNALFPGRGREELRKMVKFGIVGLIGVATNMICLSVFKEVFNTPLVFASFLAIEISIITNFLMNDNFTFKGAKCQKSFLHRMFSYNSICIGSMIINVTVLVALTFVGINYLIGNAIGIVIGYIWNFLMNRRITWVENSPKF
ncbi:MAG: glycosyltransferase family 2 protein [Candidatus Paceibacterota bacterium]|jgi:dolichol-phosphate mannosyltransferase